MWGHMQGWGDGGPGWGWFMVGHVLWWILILVGIVVLLRWAFGREARDGGTDRALHTLRERFARGEIDQKEFEERKRVLGG